MTSSSLFKVTPPKPSLPPGRGAGRGWGEARRGVLLLALLALLLPVQRAAGAAVEVLFLSPHPATPLFGTIDLLVNVRSDEAVSKVVFTVDGKTAGELKKPPFKVQFDVGQENVPHHVQV